MANTLTPTKPLTLLYPVAMLGIFIAVYWDSLAKMIMRWNNGDDNYCYLVVPLALYLCWEKRDTFRFAEFTWSAWGLVPFILGLGLMVLGEKGSVETLLYLGVWLTLTGMAAVLYGGRIRRLVFPLIILGFIVPLPPFINSMLTLKLKMAASEISAGIFNLAGLSVVQDGNIIELRTGKLEVADACSGLRYFMPMLLMSLLIGQHVGRRLGAMLILLVLVIPLSIGINVLRVVSAGLLAVAGYPELTHNLFHDFSGWLAFMLAGLVLYAMARSLNRIMPLGVMRPAIDTGALKTDRRLPLVLTLLLVILTAGGGMLVNRGGSAAHTPQRLSFENFPERVGPWQGSRAYLSREILDALWADDYLLAEYRREGADDSITVLIPYYAWQGTRHTAHAPQSCLVGSGWAPKPAEDLPVELSDGAVITFKTMWLTRDDQRMLGAYCFLQRGRVITSPWENKLWLMWDSLARGRTDGALVRVELRPGDAASPEQARAELAAFMTSLWPLLSPYIPS